MSTITVTNSNDNGAGSLRAAVAQAGNGDTIVFAANGTNAIRLSTPLVISKNVTIDGDVGAYGVSFYGGIAVQSGATVTLEHLNFENSNSGQPATDNAVAGQDGTPGVDGNRGKGGDGGGGENATMSSGVATNAGPALENDGVLTLFLCDVSGIAVGIGNGGSNHGADGADGGVGGNGGKGDTTSSGSGAVGGIGGDGGSGSNGTNGGDEVGGILNTGTLTIIDSVISGQAVAGDGGAGGDGGDGGVGGAGGSATPSSSSLGGKGGNGGSGGAGGDGGKGGSAVGGILNTGTVTIVGAAVLYDDSAQAGAAGAGGAGGAAGIAGVGGANGSGGSAPSGMDGADGASGSSGVFGTQTVDYLDKGTTSGTFTINHYFYDFVTQGTGQGSNVTIARKATSPAIFTYKVGEFGGYTAGFPDTGSVAWKVVLGANSPLSSDFAGATSGVLDFSANQSGNFLGKFIVVQLNGDAHALASESFFVVLFDPAAGDVLGSISALTQNVVFQAAARDLNNDGFSDILFRNASGVTYLWSMNGANVSGGATTSVQVGTNWQIKGLADFNGDGKADLLWVYNNAANASDPLNGVSYISLQNGPAATGGGVVQQLASVWQVAGGRDFNGDGVADVLYRNTSTGQTYLDIMNGSSVNWAASGFTSQQVNNANWKVAAVADFNDDGNADVLWRYNNAGNASDPLNGTLYEWAMNGKSVTSAGLLSQQAGAAWQVAGAGDFNGDGKADLLFRNSSTGQTYIDFMNGATVTSGAPTQWQIDNSWAVASIGDFNGDGISDILFQQSSTGNTYIWQMNGANVTSGALTSLQSGAGWAVQNGVLIG